VIEKDLKIVDKTYFFLQFLVAFFRCFRFEGPKKNDKLAKVGYLIYVTIIAKNPSTPTKN